MTENNTAKSHHIHRILGLIFVRTWILTKNYFLKYGGGGKYSIPLYMVALYCGKNGAFVTFSLVIVYIPNVHNLA